MFCINKVADFTGIQPNSIRRAKSFLIANAPNARLIQGCLPIRYKVLGF